MIRHSTSQLYLYIDRAASRCTPNQFASVISGVHHPSALPNFAPPLRSFLWPFLFPTTFFCFLPPVHLSASSCLCLCLCICIHNVYRHASWFFRPENFSQGSCFLGWNHFLPSYPMLLGQDPGMLPPLGALKVLQTRAPAASSSPASGDYAWPVSLTHPPPARPSRSASPSSCPRRSRRSRPSESQSPQTRLFLFEHVLRSTRRIHSC